MKRIIYIITLLIPTIGFVSCNDEFLDRTPIGEISESLSFQSYELCIAYERQLYPLLAGYTFAQGPSLVYSREESADAAKMGSAIRDTYSGFIIDKVASAGYVVPGEYASQNKEMKASLDSYTVPYEYIRNANIILNHISEINGTDSQKEHIEAVARFFRAYAHYCLLINFGDCIYVDHLVGDSSPELTGKRDSRLFVSDKIFDELKWCSENIHDELCERNTINSDIVLSFMSRFCLFEGTWRKYHNVDDSSAQYKSSDLLRQCVNIGETLSQKYPTLYLGDGNDIFPGSGWGQLWTTEDLKNVNTVFLYEHFSRDYKMHRVSHVARTGNAKPDMPQWVVDMYLTQDGLPIHNSNVKTYDYANGEYSLRINPYDYAKCDPYKTFRKRDPRLWQMVMPPFVIDCANNSLAFKVRPDLADGLYNEYINQMGIAAEPTGLSSYLSPAFETGFRFYDKHKVLPMPQWRGFSFRASPNCREQCVNTESVISKAGGQPLYNAKQNYLNTNTGYYVWKEVAVWEKNDNANASNIADKPIFKLEEVLLNYAEASFELGTFSQEIADNTINRLRDRASVGRMTISSITSSFDPDRDPSVDPVLWEIRRERLIELMGEGFSWEDVRRWKKGDWFVNKHCYGCWIDASNDKVLGKIISISGGETGLMNETTHQEATLSEIKTQLGGHLYHYQDPLSSGKGWLDKYYLEPLPTNELVLNNNLTQNPYWE